MKKSSYNVVIGLVAIVVILGIIGTAGYFVSRPGAPTVQGEAEASEYRVSGKVPGRIEKLYARAGDHVHKGDTLAMIDSPEVRAKLRQVNALISAASAQKEKADKGARSEQIAGAYQIWQAAKVQETVMKKSFERIKGLYEQKVVSAQKYDEVSAKYEASVAQSAAAKSQYDMAVNGAREEDKKAAAALVEQAEGARQEVEGYMDELYLISPADGVVSAVYPKVGELVGQGAPVMTVTDLTDVWFTFNVREDMLHSLKTGDKINLSIPAMDGVKCSATVTYIAVRESYATWKASREVGEYDAKTFEIRAVPDSPVDGIRPGMSVLVVR